MNRRQILVSLVAAASTTTAVSTGAFTSVGANRTLSVAVADDNDALLALAPVDGSPNASYVSTDGSDGTLGINMGGDDDSVLGSGVNADALTRVNNLFQIENQGTQPVTVTADKFGDHPDAATFAVNYSTDHPSKPFWGPDNATFHYLDSDKGQNATISAGDVLYVSLEVDTAGLSPGDNVLRSLAIRAEAVE